MRNNRYRNIGFRFIEKFITKAEKCNNYWMHPIKRINQYYFFFLIL